VHVPAPVPAPVPAVTPAKAAEASGAKPPGSKQDAAEFVIVPGLQQPSGGGDAGGQGQGAAGQPEPLNPLVLQQTLLPNPAAAAGGGGQAEAPSGKEGKADLDPLVQQRPAALQVEDISISLWQRPTPLSVKALSMEGTPVSADGEGGMGRVRSRNWTKLRNKMAQGELKSDIVKHPMRSRMAQHALLAGSDVRDAAGTNAANAASAWRRRVSME